MEISKIIDPDRRQAIARSILEALPEWFGIPESREEYIAGCAGLPFFAAFDRETPVGFLCLAETGKDTLELYVLGVLKDFHRRGIGRALFSAARKEAVDLGYSFLQVKTVQMGRYPEYDRTNLFYRSLGFKEFEVFPELWGASNPCQVYVMSLTDPSPLPA